MSEIIRIKQATREGYIEMESGGVCDLSYPTSKFRRGRVQGRGNISPTITTGGNAIYKVDKFMDQEEKKEENGKKKPEYKIRKLTPKECFRLMDVTDEDADKMLAVNSNSQCYKQAGNSIVVACLVALFSQLHICQHGNELKTWNDGLYKEMGYGE